MGLESMLSRPLTTGAMSIVFHLTPAMRRALETAVMGQWRWKGPAQARMAESMCCSGLLRCVNPKHGGAAYRSTAAGRLALTARPDGRVWWFQDPDLDTVKAVRRLRRCEVCGRLGAELPRHNGTTAHGACLVRRHGWPAIVDIDDVQFSRFRVEDLVFLGVTLSDVETARTAALAEKTPAT